MRKCSLRNRGRQIWIALGGLAGAVTLLALIIAGIQLVQTERDARSGSAVDATLVAVQQEQLQVLQAFVILQARKAIPGPEATAFAELIEPLLEGTETLNLVDVDLLPKKVLPTHIVESGETIEEISEMYGVSVESIMIDNAIFDPDYLSAGQELIIPGVIIGTVSGAGSLKDEFVLLWNPSADAFLLKNWSLSDEMGHVYHFENLTLFGDGAYVFLHTGEGQDSATDLYWGLDRPAWESGKVATLRDHNFQIRSTFRIP